MKKRCCCEIGRFLREVLAVVTARESAPYWAILFAALGIRLVQQLIMSANDPMYGFLLPGGDNHTYDRWAGEISQTFWLGWDRIPFFHGPLYPYGLGFVYLRFGHSHDAAVWTQRFLGAITVVLVFHLARRLFGKRAGWIAGIMAAACPLFLLYEGEILADTHVLFLNMLVLCLLVEATFRKTMRWWAAGGIAMGLCCLGRPNALLFIPAVMGWAAWLMKKDFYRGIMAALIYCVTALLTIAPATVANYVKGGAFHWVTYSGDMNLYIGNAPESTGVYGTFPALQKIRDAEGKADKDIDWRQYLLREAQKDPLLLPRKLLRKIGLFWQSGEIPHNINFYIKRSFSPLLKIPLRWAVLAPLGLLGMMLAFLQRPPRTREDGRLVLAGFLVLYMLSIVLVFVLARLRMPALAILIIFAAYAVDVLISEIGRAMKARSLRPVARAALMIGMVGVLGWGLKTRDDALLLRWNDYFNLGSAYEEHRRYAEACDAYQKAAELAPEIIALKKICEDARDRAAQTRSASLP